MRRAKDLPEARRKQLDAAVRAAHRGSDICEGLLLWAGRGEVKAEEVDVTEVVEEAVPAELLADWIGTINYEVTTRIDERVPRRAV